MNPDVSTTLGKRNTLRLESPLFNASGVWCTTYSDLQGVLGSLSSGAVVSKSCTLDSREGNPEPRYFDCINKEDAISASINSMGLPNKGVKYYLEAAQNLENPMHKPFFLSVCGLSVEENLDILKTVTTTPNSKFYVNGIELNLSCPNIVGKPQLGKCFTLIHEKST